MEEEDSEEEGEEEDTVDGFPPALREWLVSSFTPALLLFCARLQRLHSLALSLLGVSEACTASSLSCRFHSAVHVLLSSHQGLSASFPSLLLDLFSLHLHTFHRLHSTHPPSPSGAVSHLAFLHLCAQLHSVQLLSPTSPSSSSLLSSLFVPFIRAHILQTCEDETTSHLSSLLSFTRTVVLPFASLLLPPPVSSPTLPSYLLSSTLHLYTLHLISRLFDLLISFPSSTPLLVDLHSSLPPTALQPLLLSSLSSALTRRLLHPGASTPDILHTFISLHRAMRLVEDDGVLAMPLIQQVGEYVRGRPDCVRCILRMLVGKEGGGRGGGGEAEEEAEEEAAGEGGDGEVDLSEELETEPEKHVGDDSDSEDAKHAVAPSPSTSSPPPAAGSIPHPFSALPPSSAPAPPAPSPFEGWTPDPLSAHPTITSRKGRHSDLLSLLFSLTPPSTSPPTSLTPFLDEYRSLLALRLLHHSGYARDAEVVRNERMKGRVGEEDMVASEVMVRDIEVSKRVVGRVVKEVQQAAPHALVQALTAQEMPLKGVGEGEVKEAQRGMEGWTLFVLSHEFWPSDLLEPSQALTAALPSHPLRVLQALAASTYHRLFSPRTLTFLPLLGSCDVTIDLHDRSLRVHCDPFALAVLSTFESHPSPLTLDDICGALTLPAGDEDVREVVRGKVGWWMGKNVLTVVKEVDEGGRVGKGVRWEVMEELSSEDLYEGGEGEVGEEEERKGAGEGAGGGGGVDVYVLSVLTTFGELSCDRLHVYLKRYGVTSEFAYNWQEMQLQDHLQGMEQRGLLQQKDGLYRKR